MARLVRLDAELVRRGLARARAEAAELIDAGLVTVDGRTATKAATQVDPAQAIDVSEPDGERYVSRGGYKLAGALDALGADGPAVAGRICLDAGASTGGFTDVLLRRGAAQVIGVDVGYGQIAWSLRTDPRVVTIERTNIRHLDAASLPASPSLVVADLSFISLTQVIVPLAAVCEPKAELLLMVKPQFEVGRHALQSGGVVRDPALRRDAIVKVARAGIDAGLSIRAVVPSPLPGPKGNVEFFVLMVKGAATDGLRLDDLEAAAAAAVEAAA